MLRDITHATRGDQLPKDWKLSFGRVGIQPLKADASWFAHVAGTAFGSFERASAKLVRTDSAVRATIQRGVDAEPWVRDLYVNHPRPFRVRRLDIVDAGRTPAICESDEMPGGLTHAYWLDHTYGINQRRWERAFQQLTGRGTLVFAVSTSWSAPYVRELTWLASHLTKRGVPAAVVTDKDARSLKVGRSAVTYKGASVATIWRQFPVFEAGGAFAGIVKAAAEGKVDLVPELASWGNKAWLGVFWRKLDFYRAAMSPASFRTLQNLVPYSRLVTENQGYPSAVRINGKLVEIADLDQLKGLTTAQRKLLVAKTCGANTKAARSYGVALGTSLTGRKWGQALDALLDVSPLLIQEYRPPVRRRLTVVNALGSGTPRLEDFEAKFLVRPWVIDGELVSATAFATTPDSSKLHGTTTGAEIPIQFS